MYHEERVLKVEFQSFKFQKVKAPKICDPPPPIHFPRKAAEYVFIQTKLWSLVEISRLPYNIFQSLIVVLSEWRKGKLRQHYSVTAADQFVRACKEGRCMAYIVHDLLLICMVGVETEQLNEILASRFGVRKESRLHQHTLLLNVYMLFSRLFLINWLFNLFVYFAAIMKQPALAVDSGNLLCQLSRLSS